MAFVEIGLENDIEKGKGKVIEKNGKTLAVFNVDGTFYAIDNTCVHRGGPLGEGELDGENVTCPWHGWQYNVKNGESSTMPNMKVNVYPIKIENGKVLAELE